MLCMHDIIGILQMLIDVYSKDHRLQTIYAMQGGCCG